MPESLTLKLLESIISAGPVAVVLLIAVWWLTRSNTTLVNQLGKERKDRLDKMDKHIERLETKCDNCEADRNRISMDLVRLQTIHGMGIDSGERMP